MNNITNPQERRSLFGSSWVDDNRVMRGAVFGALTFHIIFFFLYLPGWSPPLPEEKLLRIEQPRDFEFKPPEVERASLPERKPLIKPGKLIPIPDPTPHDPEPIIEPALEPAIIESSNIPIDFPPSGWTAPRVSHKPKILDATMVPPRLIDSVQPKYPKMAVLAGVQGVVRLRAVIHVDGTVGDIEIIQSLGRTGCDEAAIEALRQYRYEPATQNGVSVAVFMELEVTFRLK